VDRAVVIDKRQVGDLPYGELLIEPALAAQEGRDFEIIHWNRRRFFNHRRGRRRRSHVAEERAAAQDGFQDGSWGR
jgi:hypothetical protein